MSPAFSASSIRGRTPTPIDHEIGLERAAALELDLLALDRRRRVLEVKDDALLFMQGADEIAHLRTQDTLHRPLVRRHDMDLDLAVAQRRRDLEPDEAGADHHRALRLLRPASMIARLSASERRTWTWG